MELMMHGGGHSRGALQTYDYDQDTAHTVEVQREVDENGELGSFGFTLLYERPSIVGTIVPGGPADRAGLKKQEVVIAVNGQDTTNLSHHEVVTIIFNTKTPGVWLTVCEGPQSAGTSVTPSTNSITAGSRLGINRVRSLGSTLSVSYSTPSFPRSMADYNDGGPPPKYQDVAKFGRQGSGNVPRQRDPPVSSMGVSPLAKSNGYHSSSTAVINRKPMQLLATFGSSDQTLLASSKSSPTPAAASFTSAQVLVLYNGSVEIPESWSNRELSSKCLQECTRHLLSQRQEFMEAFLEVNLTCMRILAVSQAEIYKHKRDELYYAGACSNDEQTFGIVTRKLDHKNVKKSLSGSNIGKPMRAHMCHVFKVIQHKSVLALHSGGDGKDGKKSKQPSSQHKQKTVPVKSCMTIVNAIQGLFTGATNPGGKIFDDITLKPTLQIRNSGSGSSNESMYGGSPDKPNKKKKLDVVDLRPSAFLNPPANSILTSTPSSSQNMYVSAPSSTSTPSPLTNNHTRSHSNPSSDYLSLGTPAFLQRAGVGGGSGGGGGGGGSWYANDSPKEEHHSRTRSWDNKSPQLVGRGHDRSGHHHETSSSSSGTRRSNKNNSLQYDKMRRFSDDSSLSSYSDSRASSPTKISHRSSFASHSRSPSPKSLSYSSPRSRSPSPVQTNRWTAAPGPVWRPPRMGASAARKHRSGMAHEVGSIRSGAISPTSMARSFRGSRANLRRQGSDSSIMDLHDLSTMNSQMATFGPSFGGLPPKNSHLSSSIGSVATITTVADKAAEDPAECGRVGGWVASFDKLLADPLGVHTLLEFLKKEHCEENVLFWKDTQEFKENAPQDKNLSATVKRIYDEYLAPSSPNTVNIDDRVKKSIESRLGNPPLNIFSEAVEQIYQLMKMDCYPRFKKSPLVKECLLAEMEGKPLPIDLPQEQRKDQQQTRFTGIWSKHREFGFGRSFFGRFGRGRVQQEQPAQVPPSGMEIWGVTSTSESSPPSAKPGKDNTPPDNRRSKEVRKSGSTHSPRLRKSGTVKETKTKRRSGNHHPPTPDSAAGHSNEEFPPEDHLNLIQGHKSNVFEVNLPNKVTKIMAVPQNGTVRDAIRPVLTKHGYSLDIMELHFANNFKLIDLDSSANILIGQHIIVIKSKNTFTAAFPDVLERILPADGTKSIGDLFVGVLKEIGKLQNFTVAIEGARVPLELSTDTSVLVGQRVVVKYQPGPLNWKGAEVTQDLQSNSKTSLHSSSNSSGRTDMDDLFSMIERLSGDNLADQRISPTPVTPEEAEELRNRDSPGDMRRRTQSQGKKRSPNSTHHRPLASSKSTDSIDVSQQQGSSHHYMSRHRRERERRHRGDNMLRPPGSGTQFSRTHSGGTLHNGGASSSSSSTSNTPTFPPHSSSVGPANSSSAQDLRSRNLSPPPPTSKPPPLPSHAARKASGSRHMQQQQTRWSGVSYKSTDSASSEDSLTADLPRHPRQHGPTFGGSAEQIQGHNHPDARSLSTGSRPGTTGNKPNSKDQPQYFPRAHTPTNQGPTYGVTSQPQKQYQPSRSSSNPRSNVPASDYPGYSATPGQGTANLAVNNTQHSRKTSWQGKPMDYSNASHPLQMSVTRGHSQSIGSTLSSYPWHSAHNLPQQQQIYKQQPQPKRASMPRTAAERSRLMENPELMQAGDQIVQQEIEEYRRNSSSDAGSPTSSGPRTPLSPTTHTLLTEEPDLSVQRETFV